MRAAHHARTQKRRSKLLPEGFGFPCRGGVLISTVDMSGPVFYYSNQVWFIFSFLTGLFLDRRTLEWWRVRGLNIDLLFTDKNVGKYS